MPVLKVATTMLLAVLVASQAHAQAAAAQTGTAPGPRADTPSAAPDDADDADDADDGRRLEIAGLPALAASSDIGFAFGVYLKLTRMDPGRRPFDWQFTTLLQTSVKDGPDGIEVPIHDDFVSFQKTGLLDGKLRLYGEIGYQQNIVAGWYGLGNASSADADANARRYQFYHRLPLLRFMGRLKLLEHVETFAAIDLQYSSIKIYDGSKLQQDIAASEAGTGEQLFGYDDSAVGVAHGGLIWDDRDDEVNPLAGGFHQASVRGSPGQLTGAEHDFVGFNLSASQFVSLADEYLVVALRLSADLMQGSVPFYMLGTTGGTSSVQALGGKDGVRGVPARRYNGKVKAFGNLELRSTFYEISKGFDLGASAFFDAGRSWYDLSASEDLDATGVGLKYGLGAGPQLRWGESTVVRIDVAYSPDADPVGFYVDASRAF